MLVSNALLLAFLAHQARFCLLDMYKNLSSQFFDLAIENPLGRVTLAKLRSSLYGPKWPGNQGQPEFLVPGNQETTRPPGNSGKRKKITRKLP